MELGINEENLQKGNMPHKAFPVGNCKVTLWENEINTKNGTVKILKAQLQKGYQDKDGNWKNTNSLDVKEIRKAVIALEDAEKYILTQYRKESTD